MKSFFKALIVVAATALMCSCSSTNNFTKRHYRSGYYFDRVGEVNKVQSSDYDGSTVSPNTNHPAVDNTPFESVNTDTIICVNTSSDICTGKTVLEKNSTVIQQPNLISQTKHNRTKIRVKSKQTKTVQPPANPAIENAVKEADIAFFLSVAALVGLIICPFLFSLLIAGVLSGLGILLALWAASVILSIIAIVLGNSSMKKLLFTENKAAYQRAKIAKSIGIVSLVLAIVGVFLFIGGLFLVLLLSF
jgi:hypothetical protein